MTTHQERELLWVLETYVSGLTHYHKDGSTFVQLQPVIIKLQELRELHYETYCEECASDN